MSVFSGACKKKTENESSLDIENILFFLIEFFSHKSFRRFAQITAYLCLNDIEVKPLFTPQTIFNGKIHQ